MIKPLTCVMATLFLCILHPAFASDTLFLSLRQAMEIAVNNNPDLKRVRLNENILTKQIETAKGTALPQLSGTAGFTDNFALPSQLLPGEIIGETGQIPIQFGVRYGLNAGLEVNQMIYNKSYLENIKKLDAVKSTYQLQTLSTMEDLVYNVAQIYIQYQITREQEGILKANLERIEHLVHIGQAQYENGIIKKLDVDQLKVNRTNLHSELSNLDIAAEQQLNVLRFYLALDPNQMIELNQDLLDSGDYPISDELMLAENLDYRILKQQLLLAEMDNEVIKAGYYPTINAFAQFNYNGQGDKFNLKKDNYYSFGYGLWGLRLSMPIFDGFQKRKKLEENKIVIDQIKLSAYNFENAVEMEYKNAKIKIENNKELITTQEDNMKLAQELYEVTKLSYQEGVAPLTELLNAETSLKEAQSQYLTALLNNKLAELDHVKVSGQLAQLIKSINNNTF
ncbi:TolC family protein [Membranihabitans marinus]|uniref:TolC family protein n=1 Tax=Membranihabitans marinus TaxID=1227546 RepID=UPI001F27A185|nr:TolC family protein [Membranihabitans marinus]